MNNPFNPGSGSPPSFLAGRDDELCTFKNMAKSITDSKQENMILTGLRGTGKTVLLNEFAKVCLEEKIFPIKRLQFNPKHNDPEEFYSALKYDMSTAAASLIKTATQKTESASSALRPKSRESSKVSYYEPPYVHKSIPFENHLEEYLSENWPIFQKNGYSGVVFLFDEFHFISDDYAKKSYMLADLIGAINELQRNGFPYHLVLSGLPKISQEVNKARSYSERMFNTIVLKNLSKDDAIMAISKPLKNSPYSFSKGLIDAIINDVKGYPYFLQFCSKELIDSTSKKRIELKDYQSLRPIIIKQLGIDFFDPRMDELTPTEHKLLISIAKAKTEYISFKDIQTASEIKKQSLSKHLQSLERKGLIHNHQYEMYGFSLPIFQDYIIRKYA